jgi:dTDP-4-amino-4,6-dideoxygalactose transaminase
MSASAGDCGLRGEIVEDACQAHGATPGQEGRGFGLFGCWFCPTKNLGGYGDGMIVTRSADHAGIICDELRAGRFEHHLRGFNCRVDELQAAILRVKLRHLDTWNAGRDLARGYDRGLKGTGVRFRSGDQTHVYCLCHTASVADRLREWPPTVASTPTVYVIADPPPALTAISARD